MSRNTDFEDEERAEAEPKGVIGAASVIAAGIFMLCMIFIFAKVLFSSNSAEVPKDIDTATINTDLTVPQVAESSDDEGDGDVAAEQTGAEGTDVTTVVSTEEVTETTTISADMIIATMYTTQYAYLHKEPAKDAENIICMSPGIECSVLGYEDNGYVHITFMNVDGPLTGYIYQDYLSEYQTVLPPWQS